jgi:phosphopantothenoylcysteine decarboxylase / phosphopantothenate---cysteine ligase
MNSGERGFPMLEGKKIVLGITGGIAAYKAAELTRELVKRKAAVKVVMTRNAAEFISPLTLQTLSGNVVHSDMFSLTTEYEIDHISLARYADIVLIAPATANVIGKIASGLADDLLTTVVMATRAPVLICPAMNNNMYDNAIVQDNIRRLKEVGYFFIEPAYGELACKDEGRGRLPELSDIIEEVETIFTVKDFSGERVLVTAGPTCEPFDPVRYITNYSSGKMGYSVAIAAKRRGAKVVLVSGPTSLPVPRGIDFIQVTTARDMRNAVLKNFKESKIIVKAAAVADYRPAIRSDAKIKKRKGPMTPVLERNPDIIEELGRKKGNRFLVGFAVETENLVKNAKAKLIGKNMDIIVANDVTKEGAGFACDTNIVKILDRKGGEIDLPMMDKIETADRILDRIKDLMAARKHKS